MSIMVKVYHAPISEHVTGIGNHYRMTSYKADSQTIQDSKQFHRTIYNSNESSAEFPLFFALQAQSLHQQ